MLLVEVNTTVAFIVGSMARLISELSQLSIPLRKVLEATHCVSEDAVYLNYGWLWLVLMLFDKGAVSIAEASDVMDNIPVEVVNHGMGGTLLVTTNAYSN